MRSLPFFQDIDAIKQAAGANKKGKKKEHTVPKMCFQIGSTRSVQTVHGANDGKYAKVTKPGVDLGAGTQASAATTLNAEQPVVKIASSHEDDASSSEESEEGSDELSSSDKTSASASSDEDDVQSNGPAGSG